MQRAIGAFTETLGYGAIRRRQLEIARLPKVDWKGLTLFTIRCDGEFGNGPHDVNVPESLLWSLISLTNFKCPYHR